MGNQFEVSQPKRDPLEDLSVLADFLRPARLLVNLSQPQMAKKIGVSEATIRKVEEGDGLVPDGKLEAFASAYGVDLETLRAKFKITEQAREKFSQARKSNNR